MALLASPNVGVRRRAFLRTARLAFDWTDLHACAACRAVALARRRINLMHGRRSAALRPLLKLAHFPRSLALTLVVLSPMSLSSHSLHSLFQSSAFQSFAFGNIKC